MDNSHLDDISRALATGHSRRVLARLLSPLALAGPLALLAHSKTEAKRKKGKKGAKKKRRKNLPVTMPCEVCVTGCPFSDVGAAIAAATPGASIRLCPGSYIAQVTLSKSLTLLGTGADPTATVLSHPSGPILTLTRNTAVLLRNLTLTGAMQDAAIVSSGASVTLEQVRLTGNKGGFAANGGTLVVVDSVISGNTGARVGGGISFDAGTVTLARTRVEGNSAEFGGGIFNESTRLTLEDSSQVTGNTATGGPASGGGIRNVANGAVNIRPGSSVTGNTPDNCVNSSGGTGCP